MLCPYSGNPHAVVLQSSVSTAFGGPAGDHAIHHGAEWSKISA